MLLRDRINPRFIVLVIILSILMVLMFGLAADLALVRWAPFLPGETLFPIQDAAEQILLNVTLDKDPTGRCSPESPGS
jgi:hypothetical protein